MTNEEMDDLLELDEELSSEDSEIIDIDTVESVEDIEAKEEDFDSVIAGFESLSAEIDAGRTTDVAKASKKFESLSDAFNVSMDGMDDELDTIISEAKGEIVEHIQNGGAVTPTLKETAFNVDNLGEDFKDMRRTLKDSLSDSRAIQKKFTDEMLMSTIEDISPQVLMGYSELMKAVTKQVEVLAKIYKDVADTQVKLKEYLKTEQMVEDRDGPAGTTNVQNNYILTTNDLIDKFLPKSN